MHQQQPPVNTIAPLTNVSLCMSALERVMNRSRHLPGMVVLYGPAGFGKTKAATYAANKHRAYHIRCCQLSTRKSILESILKEMGITPEKTMAGQLEQITEQLTTSQRPLIVDEIDHLVEKGAVVEIIRDIHDLSACSAILLIGEERVPGKLKKWERFHRRILDWVPAQPADMHDADQLRRLYVAPQVEIADDLLQDVHALAKGSVGRICVNLDRIQDEALSNGWTVVDRETWGKRPLYTGDAPARRV
jgi:chromosomal replication initiation ATPase DnaA